MILPFFLLTSAITCAGVSFDHIESEQGNTNLNFPSVGFVPQTFTGNTVKLTVSSSSTALGLNNHRSVSDSHVGNAIFKFELSSVDYPPPDGEVTVIYTMYEQASASAQTNNNATAYGHSGTSWFRHRAKAQIADDDGAASQANPNPVVSKKKLAKYHSVNWTDSTYGYYHCFVAYNTKDLSADSWAVYNGSHTGNIPEGTGSGTAYNKATFASAKFGTGSSAGLQLNALGSLSDRNLLLSLTNQYGSPLDEYFNDTVGGLSDLEFDISSSGTYFVTISGQGMLRKKISVTLVPGSTANIGNVATYLGDINGDNIIDSADTAAINSYLGVSSGTNRWIYGDSGSDVCGRDCDLNNDGIVNSADLAIATANLNRVGD